MAEAVQPNRLRNSQKTFYKTFSTSCRPRVYKIAKNPDISDSSFWKMRRNNTILHTGYNFSTRSSKDKRYSTLPHFDRMKFNCRSTTDLAAADDLPLADEATDDVGDDAPPVVERPFDEGSEEGEGRKEREEDGKASKYQ